jgi:hypothetical protein
MMLLVIIFFMLANSLLLACYSYYMLCSCLSKGHHETTGNKVGTREHHWGLRPWYPENHGQRTRSPSYAR